MLQKFVKRAEFLAVDGDDGAFEEFVAVDKKLDFPRLLFAGYLDLQRPMNEKCLEKILSTVCMSSGSLLEY